MRCGILLAVLAACAAPRRGGGPVLDGELIDLMFLWREGERRRDPEMAQRALHFARSSDRRGHKADLAALRGVPAGPIRVPAEFRLVARPEGGGEGECLFLEPAGGVYAATIVTIVRVRGAPRILYAPPDVTAEERATRRPEEIARLAAARRIEHWQALEGRKLDEEVARLKRALRLQVAARTYAERERLPMAPFEPDPAAILAELEPCGSAAARAQVIALLREA